MSVTERLQAMDQLWDSLDRYGDEMRSPDWHHRSHVYS
jgi:Putative addiction module component